MIPISYQMNDPFWSFPPSLFPGCPPRCHSAVLGLVKWSYHDPSNQRCSPLWVLQEHLVFHKVFLTERWQIKSDLVFLLHAVFSSESTTWRRHPFLSSSEWLTLRLWKWCKRRSRTCSNLNSKQSTQLTFSSCSIMQVNFPVLRR